MTVRKSRTPRFSTVSLDVDSTLCGIEGIDWLAARRGGDIATRIAALTEAAMSGEISISEVYAQRLQAVAPGRSDVEALAAAYQAALAPGAGACVSSLGRAGVRTLIVSGGVRQALLPLASALGIALGDVHGVELHFGSDGSYSGFDTTSPLTAGDGKARVLQAAHLSEPVLHVGDGITDAAARDGAGAFAAFTGFVARDVVIRRADYTVESFPALTELVLG